MPAFPLQSLLDLFLREGPKWIRAERSAHRSVGRSLSPEEGAVLEPFFGGETIARVRVIGVPVIPNPGFYAVLMQQGIPIPLDFSQTSGITFDDTVLVSASRPVEDEIRLLFHELVHVVQFELLGIDGFIQQYVTGWAENGFRYETIPLEVQAYDLDARFAAQPDAPFSVHSQVARSVRVNP